MLVSMLTGAAVQMVQYAVTILSTLVQLLAASAITIVIPLAVIMHLADVHAWQCYTNIVKRSQRLKCLISITCMLSSFMGHVTSDKHCIAALIAGCTYAITGHAPAGCMFLVQVVLAFWGSVDPLMAIVENEIEDMLPQSPHCKVPHPKHANGRYWRRIRYAGRRHRQQPLKRYMSWLTLRHNNLCYLHSLMQTAEQMTDESQKRNTRQHGNNLPNNTHNYTHDCQDSNLAGNKTQSEATQNDTSNFGNKPIVSDSKPEIKQQQTSPHSHPDASKTNGADKLKHDKPSAYSLVGQEKQAVD